MIGPRLTWRLCGFLYLFILVTNAASVGLGNRTGETIRAAFLASADQAIEVANIYGDMALMLHQIGAIILGLVMLKGV